ncbi:MAG TPA: Ni/Fe hydrogenase subunit alpha [Geobacteraceae bacterium]|nr:Ni/Fe hydrogenase subunit alpha [Geobacteraceae bacterium]
MAKKIHIEPVTRIEGHAKITIQLDDTGAVDEARLHVVEFRAFEKFCIGRPFYEMPGITNRICGICPTSHALASVKAGDSIMGVAVPPTAVKLREIMNWGQFVQSHALSFFHLSAPDLLLGFDSDPATRNVMGLIQKYPDLARKGVRLRGIGQEIIRIVADKSIHQAWAVPGGVREPLTAEKREAIRAMLPEAFETIETALNLLKSNLDKFAEEVKIYDFPSMFAGLVTPAGGLEHYDGLMRFVDTHRKIIEPGIQNDKYRDYIEEASESWSYLKFPYFKSQGPYNFKESAGMYRVGPLGRLNVCDYAGTPRADRELEQFRRLGKGGAVTSGFHFHYARLIEILFALEKIEETLKDKDILDDWVRAEGGVNRLKGVGMTEAPRGTLIHDYTVDRNGLITDVNLVVSTGHNNMAMNRTITNIAKQYIKGDNISEGILNRVEHGIRAFDPCLSCSTHAVGKMPLTIELLAPDGSMLKEISRG